MALTTLPKDFPGLIQFFETHLMRPFLILSVLMLYGWAGCGAVSSQRRASSTCRIMQKFEPQRILLLLMVSTSFWTRIKIFSAADFACTTDFRSGSSTKAHPHTLSLGPFEATAVVHGARMLSARLPDRRIKTFTTTMRVCATFLFGSGRYLPNSGLIATQCSVLRCVSCERYCVHAMFLLTYS